MTQHLVLQRNSFSEEEEEYKKYLVKRNWPKYLQINIYLVLITNMTNITNILRLGTQK